MRQALPGKHYYLAPLKERHPEDGLGVYELGTGRVLHYSDGGQWFFAMDTGTPSFYAAEGALYLPDGRLASLDMDLSLLAGIKREPQPGLTGAAPWVLERLMKR